MAEEGVPPRPPMAELRAELSALKPRALKKRAAEVGVDEEKIDEADDADDVKGTLIALIVEKEEAAGGGGGSGSTVTSGREEGRKEGREGGREGGRCGGKEGR